MPKEIPIELAKRIAYDYDFTEVVIYAFDRNSELEHVTTFGKSKADCWDACCTGNKIKIMMGWPEELCNAEPDMTNKIEE